MEFPPTLHGGLHLPPVSNSAESIYGICTEYSLGSLLPFVSSTYDKVEDVVDLLKAVYDPSYTSPTLFLSTLR